MQSLKIRYLSKLISNGFGALFTFVGISFLTRILGPNDFGLFQFLKIIFEKIIQFFLIGISGLFPKLSQKPENKNLIIFSSLYFFIASICICTFLFLIFILDINKTILSSATFATSLLVLFLVILLTFIEEIRKIMDAWLMTVKSEIIILSLKSAVLILIILIFYLNLNELNLYLAFHNILLVVTILFLIRIVLKKIKLQTSVVTLKETATDLKNFATPLFFANTFGILATIVERWMLQFFSGSIEQAYFSIGYQFTFLIILFTGAFTPLLLREYAAAFEKKNTKDLKDLFMNFMPLFYFISSIIACFLATNSNIATQIIGGEEYTDATFVVSILIMSSIHQTYGQLGGVLLLATNKSKEYAIVNSTILPISILMSYFLIAPESHYGLSLGAIGLAISLLISQIIYTNTLLVINAKYLRLNIFNILIHQIAAVFIPLLIAILLKYVVVSIFSDNYIFFIISGMVYLLIIGLILYLLPMLIFSSRDDLLIKIKSLIKFN